jgi:hypothetical protein
LVEAIAGIDNRFGQLLSRHGPNKAVDVDQAAALDDKRPTAADFRILVTNHDQHKLEQQPSGACGAATPSHRRVDRPTPLRGKLARADGQYPASGRTGRKGIYAVAFPERPMQRWRARINSTLPEWRETLRGEAGEMYLRWKRDLEPHGFTLSAKVLDFPGGMPGDIGLFLVWSE